MSFPSELYTRRKLTDSPWFWVLLFSVAAVIFLLAMAPKYSQRQSRLELQYHARQEIARRQVEGHTAPADGELAEDEPTVAPPPPGEVIIGLRPLIVAFAALAAVSALMLWRAARPLPRSLPRSTPQPPTGPT